MVQGFGLQLADFRVLGVGSLAGEGERPAWTLSYNSRLHTH